MTQYKTNKPDLSNRPYGLTVEHKFSLPIDAIYEAWTEGFEKWFAEPGTAKMTAKVNEPYFYETVHKGENQSEAARHSHYGRFLELEKNTLVQMTWVTGTPGTDGAETIVTVDLSDSDQGTNLVLRHDGFSNEPSMKMHEEAWPQVLLHMETCLTEGTRRFGSNQ